MNLPTPWRLACACMFLVTGLACGGLSMKDASALAKACEGQVVPGAGPHRGGKDGFAYFVQEEAGALYRSSADGVHYKLSGSGIEGLADVRTVFCLDHPVEVPEGNCHFDQTSGIGIGGVQVVEVNRTEGPVFPRVSIERTGRIVDPSTGQTVASHTVKEDAKPCDVSLPFEPTESTFRALPPSGISFASWTLETLGVPE